MPRVAANRLLYCRGSFGLALHLPILSVDDLAYLVIQALQFVHIVVLPVTVSRPVIVFNGRLINKKMLINSYITY